MPGWPKDKPATLQAGKTGGVQHACSFPLGVLQGSLELEELKKKPYASTLKVTQNSTIENTC